MTMANVWMFTILHPQAFAVFLAVIYAIGCGAFWRWSEAIYSDEPVRFFAGFAWPILLPFILGYYFFGGMLVRRK